MSTQFETNWAYMAELDAVNDILAAIGESPVNSLEGDANVDVVNARRILQRVNRAHQSRGWEFNIFEDYTIEPDIYSNLIPWSNAYLKLAGSDGEILINRGGYIYDKTNKTDRFYSTLSTTAIILCNFDEMPQAFRDFVVTKAAYDFNMAFFGNTEINNKLAADLEDLKVMVGEHELDAGSYNIFEDSGSVGGWISR